jgi:hypothetical protein
MRLFICSVCEQTVFFENVRCTHCGHALGFLPDVRQVSAIEPVDPGQSDARALYVALAPAARRARYRLCANSREHGVCNWLVPEADPEPLCRSCRLNDVVPDLAAAGALEAWGRLEQAKRRLLYTLFELGLPVEARRAPSEAGLCFSFMADSSDTKVFTGHHDGIITINIAEADDPFREKTRKELNEGYRTVLGHFRHEIGHYYWDRLVKDSSSLEPFRALFGDERAHYAEATQRHYREGPPADWPTRFVSPYATMHPWEDWAETFAHYLHMVDTLDTARSYGLVIRPTPLGRNRERALQTSRVDIDDFDELLTAWGGVTVALNSLNRSMGLADAYPFVLSAPASRKLSFVHGVVQRARSESHR